MAAVREDVSRRRGRRGASGRLQYFLGCAHHGLNLLLELHVLLLKLLHGGHGGTVGHDAIDVAREVAGLLAQQLGCAVHTDDLLGHRAVEHQRQELLTADSLGFLDHQTRGATGHGAHVADQVRVLSVPQVVLIQPLDARHDDVLVDVGNHLLDALAGVGDQHRQARRGAPGARRGLASHVARDHGVLVRPGRELLEHRHELVGVAAGLEERQRLATIVELGALELPDFPRVHLGDVLARRQAAGVDTHLRTRADAHVVGQRPRSRVDHGLRVTAQVRHALAGDGTGHLLVRRDIVRLAAELVVVEHRADHSAADQPHLAGVGQRRVRNLLGGEPPLAQYFALDGVPQLQGLNQVGREDGLGGVFALGDSLRAVGPQPLVEAALVEVLQHRADGVVVVAGHTQQGLQVFAGELVALDQKTIVDVRGPRSPVEQEWVDALPLVANLLGRHEAAVGPLERLALALDRALEHSEREGDDVVEKLVERLDPAALDELVFHFALHAVDAVARFFLHFAHRSVFHLQGELAKLLLVGRHLPGLHHHHELLRHFGLQSLHHVRRQRGLRRRLESPRLVGASAQERVAQPAGSRPALHRGEVDVDVRAALLSDFGLDLRVVLAIALAQPLEHALLDGPLGLARRFPALLDVGGQPLDDRLGLRL